jgi:cation diffusion facilitator family transporter
MSTLEMTCDQDIHRLAGHRDTARQRRTEWVVGLTFVTMLLEIAFGTLTGSMALLADGWHMGSHVAALGLAVFAYRYAKAQADNARFAFGTGKVDALGGYTSALFLALVAVLMVWESVSRLRAPVDIAYHEALIVAVVGLVVNLVSAWLLRDTHAHAHDGHHHDHDHHAQDTHRDQEEENRRPQDQDQDHNLTGAFLHVLADLFTSFLAIVALVGGQRLGLVGLDPLMGIIGAMVILYWAWGLLRDTSRTLLDAEDHRTTRQAVRAALESRPGHRVVDLHVWRFSPMGKGCIVAVECARPETLATYRRELLALPGGIRHLTVEIQPPRVPESAPER